MAYDKLNSRSIRLFAATPQELERNRPLLNGAFRVSRDALIKVLEDKPDGDLAMAVSVWKHKGRDGNPDYFTGELTVFPVDKAEAFIAKDEAWLKDHPRTEADNKRRRDYAINQAAAKRIGVENAPSADEELPF